MMKRLLSRKTKSVALDGPVHLSPMLERDGSGDLARDLIEIASDCRTRTAPHTRGPRFDLPAQAPIDGIGYGRCPVGCGCDDGNHSPPLCDRDALTCLDPAQNRRGQTLQLAYADLGSSHVITYVVTTTRAGQTRSLLDPRRTAQTNDPDDIVRQYQAFSTSRRGYLKRTLLDLAVFRRVSSSTSRRHDERGPCGRPGCRDMPLRMRVRRASTRRTPRAWPRRRQRW